MTTTKKIIGMELLRRPPGLIRKRSVNDSIANIKSTVDSCQRTSWSQDSATKNNRANVSNQIVDRKVIPTMQTSARDKAEKKAEAKQLKLCIEFILEECRMILPGIQALFGFQLIAVFNERFNQLAIFDKEVHLAAIFFTVTSVGLLMGPAAYHRLTSPHSMPPALCSIGTRLVCTGMAMLMISISLDIYLVTNMILESKYAGIICGAIVLIFFSTVWYVYPLISKREHRHQNEGVSTPVAL